MNRRSFFGTLLGTIAAPLAAKALPKQPGLLFHRNAFLLASRPAPPPFCPIEIDVFASYGYRWSTDEFVDCISKEEFQKIEARFAAANEANRKYLERQKIDFLLEDEWT